MPFSFRASMTSWKPSDNRVSALVATWGSAVPMGLAPVREGYGKNGGAGAALTEVKGLECRASLDDQALRASATELDSPAAARKPVAREPERRAMGRARAAARDR